MSEETDPKPKRNGGAQLTGRVTVDVLEQFNEIKENEGYETFNQFVEALLMHYYNPVKVNKENESEIKRLNAEVEKWKAEGKRLNDIILDERKTLEDRGGEISSIRSSFDDLKQAYNEKCAELEELQGIQHKMDGHILVPVNDLDMRCLEWLAAREAKLRRREDITPAVFFQYAVREMLIKGNKFAIDSVPDSVIEKFKKEINDGR